VSAVACNEGAETVPAAADNAVVVFNVASDWVPSYSSARSCIIARIQLFTSDGAMPSAHEIDCNVVLDAAVFE